MLQMAYSWAFRWWCLLALSLWFNRWLKKAQGLRLGLLCHTKVHALEPRPTPPRLSLAGRPDDFRGPGGGGGGGGGDRLARETTLAAPSHIVSCPDQASATQQKVWCPDRRSSPWHETTQQSYYCVIMKANLCRTDEWTEVDFIHDIVEQHHSESC